MSYVCVCVRTCQSSAMLVCFSEYIFNIACCPVLCSNMLLCVCVFVCVCACLCQVLMYGVEHPDVPPLKNHSRSNIIFSVNVLKDVTPIISFVEGQSEPKLPLPPQTELITISHVAYTGVYPFLINQRAVSGILDYLGALDSFASRGEDATGDDYPL